MRLYNILEAIEQFLSGYNNPDVGDELGHLANTFLFTLHPSDRHLILDGSFAEKFAALRESLHPAYHFASVSITLLYLVLVLPIVHLIPYRPRLR